MFKCSQRVSNYVCITFVQPSLSCLLFFLYRPYITHFSEKCRTSRRTQRVTSGDDDTHSRMVIYLYYLFIKGVRVDHFSYSTRRLPVADDATRTRPAPKISTHARPDPRVYTRTRSLPVRLTYNKR